MLLLDLNRLGREGRARIDAELGPDAELWHGTGLRPRAPLQVHLEAQQAGPDVVVRGWLEGRFALVCRRCLEPVEVGIEEELGLLYRAGIGGAEDEGPDVLALPRSGTLDLTEPVREQVLLAVPGYAECREDCRGLCPGCGTNRNEGTCACGSVAEDARWAPLRRLRTDE
jgi:uncharacterized protein